MRTALAWIAAAGVAVGGGAAWAQRAGALPADEAILAREQGRQWTFNAEVNIRSYQAFGGRPTPTIEPFRFQRAAVVFPLIPGSASSRTEDAGIQGRVEINDRVVAAQPAALLDGYPAGTRLGRWDLANVNAREMELHISMPVTSFRTQFDEQAAAQIDWPTGDWPAEAASCFEPQMYVNYGPDGEYDMAPVQALVREWTNNRPKSIPPVRTAKWLLAQVVEHVQPSGDGFNFDRAGMIEGVDVQGAPATAAQRRGSQFDIALLLVAVYREAGLPARLVVGYDAASSREERRFLRTRRASAPALRAWVEFALYDEARKRLTWIPVDPVALRRQSSRIPPQFMERPQNFFGSHDELDGVVPFAFQLHPPTTVRAYGSPGFWGWAVIDTPPNFSEQGLRFSASRTAQRPEEPSRPGRR